MIETIPDAYDNERAALRRYSIRETASLRQFVKAYITTLIPLAACATWLATSQGMSAWVLTAAAAGFTQNALGILMHEASHGFVCAKRWLNDWMADILVCFPIFNTVEGYRAPHLDHHRFSGTQSDPHYGLYGEYRTLSDVCKGLLFDLLGVTAVLSFLKRYNKSAVRTGIGHLLGVLAVQSTLFLLWWTVSGKWYGYVVLWMCPLISIPPLVNRIRTVVEHTPQLLRLCVYRTVIPKWWEYFLIAPYGYAHHFEHHLRPGIPYYELKAAHDALMQVRFVPTDDKIRRDGYLATFRDVLRGIGTQSA